MEDLAELVAGARKRLKLSYRDVAQAAVDQGEKLTSTSVHRIERGARTNITEATIRGLHAGLGIPLRDLRAAAGLAPTIPTQPFTLPPEANRLTGRERKLVRELVAVLLSARTAG